MIIIKKRGEGTTFGRNLYAHATFASRKAEGQEQIKRKYQPLIKEQKSRINQLEYELEKLERQYQQDMLDLEDWKKKAEAARNEKLTRLDEEKAKLL